MWKVYALLSAMFAALTAIFAKIGVKDIDSNLATAIRTSIILILTWGIVLASGHMTEIKTVPRYTWIFLVLSGIATGLSWLFYFKAIQIGDVSRVAPVDNHNDMEITISTALSRLRRLSYHTFACNIARLLHSDHPCAKGDS